MWLAHGDAMIGQGRNQILHGQRVFAVFGVLFVLTGAMATGVLDVGGAGLTVLQCVVGYVRDELLGGHGDKADDLGIYSGKASLRRIISVSLS